MALSIEAGKIVGMMYDALFKQYHNPENEKTQKSLNALCVRLVFCLYAEDAGIFGKRLLFHDYLSRYDASGFRKALIDLFKVLDQKEEERDPYLKEDDPILASFPYVNGGLFSDEDIEIPSFTDEIRTLLLKKASEDFDWSEISPTIFGAVFESTLNPDTRRSGGMHYTSIENIHKVIDPLFMDELDEEFDEILKIAVEGKRLKKLDEFQDKLASLSFLDPACGSGNFLTESYLSLRRLENKVLKEKTIADKKTTGGQISFGDVGGESPIKVSIRQFYGIEINDFAVTVAKTALWIAESQMMKETSDVVHLNLDFLPLKTNAYIVEGNALRMDWNDVIPAEKLNYIMGNPPFVGYSLQTKEQKSDITSVYVDENGEAYSTAGEVDYVAGWYFKASQMMHELPIRTAFVSTNSITQGEQVANVWKPLFKRFNVHIDFAYRTFIWESVESINAYLLDAPIVFIDNRTNPLFDVPEMTNGNKPTDGGFLLLSPEERNDLINKEPGIGRFIKRIYGAAEYINNKERYCIWLKDKDPSEFRKYPQIMERVSNVRKFRLSSPKAATVKSADYPFLFQQIRQPETNYIIVPRVSSENRRYIPIGFMSPEDIVTDSVQFIPNADLYEFGVLTSNVHMAWTRAICGRLKSDYRYSAKIVYNNYIWPIVTNEQKKCIRMTAQSILDIREKYPNTPQPRCH